MKHFITAFTLLDVLIVAASIGIVIGLLFPTERNMPQWEGPRSEQAVITVLYSGNSGISETP